MELREKCHLRRLHVCNRLLAIWALWCFSPPLFCPQRRGHPLFGPSVQERNHHGAAGFLAQVPGEFQSPRKDSQRKRTLKYNFGFFYRPLVQRCEISLWKRTWTPFTTAGRISRRSTNGELQPSHFTVCNGLLLSFGRSQRRTSRKLDPFLTRLHCSWSRTFTVLRWERNLFLT